VNSRMNGSRYLGPFKISNRLERIRSMRRVWRGAKSNRCESPGEYRCRCRSNIARRIVLS
jgi:hypothetical protein